MKAYPLTVTTVARANPRRFVACPMIRTNAPVDERTRAGNERRVDCVVELLLKPIAAIPYGTGIAAAIAAAKPVEAVAHAGAVAADAAIGALDELARAAEGELAQIAVDQTERVVRAHLNRVVAAGEPPRQEQRDIRLRSLRQLKSNL